MDRKYRDINKNKLICAWCLIVCVAIFSLVIMEYVALTRENRVKAYRSSEFLISEIKNIIASNEVDKANLEEFLKETYLKKAQAASFLIDSYPGVEYDAVKIRKLAELIGADEIHLFNKEGILYSGTTPDYYGLTLDAGEQIAYFQPMLSDPKLSMSQNIEPNTMEGKRTLYAMCWNRNRTHMVQIGVNEENFPRILQENQIENIIGKIPGDQGTDIILTDISSDEIIAATNRDFIGKKLEDIGIRLQKQVFSGNLEFRTGYGDNPIYCTIQNYHGYRITVAQYKNAIDDNVPITLVTFTEYLILVFIAMSFVLDYMYGRILQEKTYALKDGLTELYNRREYENTLEKYNKKPIEEDLVFVSMDVNGLKKVNDQRGHAAGDELLKGAAQCIRESFGPYGKTFRYGGDEFVAIIRADDRQLRNIQERFSAATGKWSEDHHMELVISAGYVRKTEYPQADIHRLTNQADQKMYNAKANYYSAVNHDRREK